eukprot:Gb_38653 [translate_table: standard]
MLPQNSRPKVAKHIERHPYRLSLLLPLVDFYLDFYEIFLSLHYSPCLPLRIFRLHFSFSSQSFCSLRLSYLS